METQPQNVNCSYLVEIGKGKNEGSLLIKETTEFFKYWKLGIWKIKTVLIHS